MREKALSHEGSAFFVCKNIVALWSFFRGLALGLRSGFAAIDSRNQAQERLKAPRQRGDGRQRRSEGFSGEVGIGHLAPGGFACSTSLAESAICWRAETRCA